MLRIKLTAIFSLGLFSSACFAEVISPPITTKPYVSRSSGNQVSPSLTTEDLSALKMPNVASNSQDLLADLKGLRIAINTARHNAQEYVYTKNGNALPVENDNYAAVIQSLVEFQNAVFTNDWRHPNIGLVGFSDVQSTAQVGVPSPAPVKSKGKATPSSPGNTRTPRFLNDNNYILFVFLVKTLQDTTLKQVPPFSRNDLDDSLQFCNNLEKLLRLPLYCGPNLHLVDAKSIKSGKIDPGLLKADSSMVASSKPAEVPIVVEKPAKPTPVVENASVAYENTLKARIDEFKTKSSPGYYDLLLYLDSAKELSENVKVQLEEIFAPLAKKSTYDADRDYGKWLIIKSRLNNDRNLLIEAGVYLISADTIGMQEHSYGPCLFDIYMPKSEGDLKPTCLSRFNSQRTPK